MGCSAITKNGRTRRHFFGWLFAPGHRKKLGYLFAHCRIQKPHASVTIPRIVRNQIMLRSNTALISREVTAAGLSPSWISVSSRKTG